MFVSVRDRDKPAAVDLAERLASWASTLAATRGTAAALAAAGLPVAAVNKVHEGRPHIVDLIKDGDIAMLLNTTDGRQAIRDSYSLRRAALMAQAALLYDVAGARALVQALDGSPR